MKREIVATAWGRSALKGERSVANNDEDSLTLAVEAALGCLRGIDKSTIDALLFASTTAPYAEKSHAGLIATVCDLGEAVFTADFAHTPRAGTSALRSGLDAVGSGSARAALVTAADCPLAYPKSDQEQLAGDGAAAVVVGRDDLLAVYKAGHSVTNEIHDTWRISGETFNHTAEARFAAEKGYQAAIGKAVKGLLAKTGLAAGDIRTVLLPTPGLREGAQLAKRLGFAPEQIGDSLMSSVGCCGAAQPLLMLVNALEAAAPGDNILLVGHGNGADALLFQATEAVSELKAAALLRRLIARKRPLESYGQYLSFKGIVETLPGEPFRTFPSTSAYWREQDTVLRFHGSRCRSCGTTTLPINRICPKCRSKDDYDQVPLSGRTATVFTYSVDNLAGRSDDPVVVQTVCEDSGKTRYYLLMTDFDAATVRIGMPVEFTFRRIYVGGDYVNYYWKCRPAVAEGER